MALLFLVSHPRFDHYLPAYSPYPPVRPSVTEATKREEDRFPETGKVLSAAGVRTCGPAVLHLQAVWNQSFVLRTSFRTF